MDESSVVRQAAAQAFDALQIQIGPRSIDRTIPRLLQALAHEGGARESALSALTELWVAQNLLRAELKSFASMAVRAQAIFPILIPTLIASPISAFHAKALGCLVEVAGTSLNRRLAQILDSLQKNAETQIDSDVKTEIAHTIRAVLASVSDTEGLHMLMLYLLGLARDPRPSKRADGCQLFASFCQISNEDLSAYHVDWYALEASQPSSC